MVTNHCLQYSIAYTFQYLESMHMFVNEQMRFLAAAPSVQMQDVPHDIFDAAERVSTADKAEPGEFYDNEKDQDHDVS